MKCLQADKRKRIEESAIRLFMEHGFDETSVNDIVKDAKLAKGTFYVYYKDKDALIHEVVIMKNITMLNQLMESTFLETREQPHLWAQTFFRYLVTFYRENPNVLRLINRSFRLETCRDFFLNGIIKDIHFFKPFLDAMHRDKESTRDTLNRFLLMMEVTNFVCYNAIFHHHPDDIEHIEELLYKQMSVALV